jgi:hypothetical protein
MNQKLIFGLLKNATMFGFNPKDVFVFFIEKLKTFIEKKQQEIAQPGNNVIVMAYVINGELFFVPTLVDENGVIKPEQKDILNVSQLIAETDIKQALKLLEEESDKENGLDFFQILEQSKIKK